MTTLAQCLQKVRDAWLAGMTVSELYNADADFFAAANTKLTMAEITVLTGEQQILTDTLRLNPEFHL